MILFKKRHERLNTLATINSADKYLEIGVSNGYTFNRVEVPYKVAVDPRFKFQAPKYMNQNTFFHEVPSDAFFSKFADQHGVFDLIFIDGLHTFEQAFRDFTSSLASSHERTIWLIDDTAPHNFIEALANTKMLGAIRTITRSKNKLWMGDVYKLVFAIHDFFPQFSYATFPEHGQTVVWRERRKNFRPVWDSMKKISALSFRDFTRYKNPHLNIMDAEAIFSLVEASNKQMEN